MTWRQATILIPVAGGLAGLATIYVLRWFRSVWASDRDERQERKWRP